MQQAISWINADIVHWRIYAVLGGYELSGFSAFINRNLKIWFVQSTIDCVNTIPQRVAYVVDFSLT